ncbi:MAG: zinc carboxypeptidase, partial [Cyclonatronaceae bacterium]
ETIRNQFQTSLSSVTGSYKMREDLLSYQRSHFRQAMEEADDDRVKAFVLSAPDDPARMHHLLDILSRHQIEVHSLARNISANDHEFLAGRDYIIPTNQPQYRLVRGLMETRTSFSDSLFYDVSTWSLPHAFNLNHAELTRRPFSRNLLVDVIEGESLMFPTGELIGGQAGMAYIFEWDGYYAPRALYDLQHEGVRTKLANREFILPVGEDGGDRSFNLGSVIVPVGIQDACTPPELHDMVEAAAERNGINVYAVNTGLAEAGADLGSPSMSVLEKPEVLLFVGDGVTVSEAGETWYELDQRYNVPVSMVEMDRFSRVDLPRYNTIIMPNGNYNGLSSRDRERLADWVSDGGLIIAYKNAVRWLANNEMAKVSFASAEDRETEGGLAYADASQNRGAQFIGGSIFEVSLDNTHPLTYGYQNETLSVFRNSTIFMEAPENPYAAPLRYTENPLVSGYVSEENLAALPGTASIIVGGRGSGRIIMMADNPNFRAFWFGTNKLFANSLFFGRTISGSTIER